MKKYQKPAAEQIQKMLTPEQYAITQKNATEAPFANEYWNHHEAGIYVDIVTGEPLFSSTDKYDSGSGWPSFTKTLHKDGVIEKTDQNSSLGERTEIRSKSGDSHLGHVFNDGPIDRGGLRYCINSASLRFIPAHQLKENGYEAYLSLFPAPSPETEKKQLAPSPITSHGLIRTRNAPLNLPGTQIASFAAGCFWGVEQEFRKQKGVVATAVGFMGGKTSNPSYEDVCSHTTGHAEVVQVEYDPKIVSFEELLDLFWHLHDPTTLNRQGPDVGDQYRSAIFFHTPAQKTQAEASRALLQKTGELTTKIVTEITPASPFYKAEEYHQQYVEKGGHAACHFRRKKK